MPTPHSKSPALSSGSGETRCSRLSVAAAESGSPRITLPYVGFSSTPGTGSDPPNTRKPPTCHFSASSRSRSKVSLSVLRNVESSPGNTSCAALSSSRHRGERAVDPASGVLVERPRPRADPRPSGTCSPRDMPRRVDQRDLRTGLSFTRLSLSLSATRHAVAGCQAPGSGGRTRLWAAHGRPATALPSPSASPPAHLRTSTSASASARRPPPSRPAAAAQRRECIVHRPSRPVR